jgi:hypothetical protein
MTVSKTVRASWFVLLARYYSDDKIKKNEIGGACRMFGVEERCVQGLVGKPEGKKPL